MSMSISLFGAFSRSQFRLLPDVRVAWSLPARLLFQDLAEELRFLGPLEFFTRFASPAKDFPSKSADAFQFASV